MFCEVYILDVPYHLDRAFDYSCEDDLALGSIVKVPFGRSDFYRLAVVTAKKDAISPAPSVAIKAVHSVIGRDFALSEELLALCHFLKERTLCTLGEAVRAILPPGSLNIKGTENVSIGKTATLLIGEDEAMALLDTEARGHLRSEGQRRVLSYLLQAHSADLKLLRDLPGVTSAQIKALAERGVISLTEYENVRNPYSRYSEITDRAKIQLSTAQSVAYAMVEELYEDEHARCGLLYGVTGSGKTKVIMKAIDRTLSDGKSVIMLVPEIALTPQTVSIFCRRYGARVAVIHSSLSQGERLDAYRRIKRGEVDLVIGTRSAIFAPLSNIGMIVIDEEHEHTYKSESNPKYHAREVASFRCGKHGALLLLASATPSVESFYKAKSEVYTMIPLRERYGGLKLPVAIVVDMREELRLGNLSPISKRLYESLQRVKENDEQAILFLNRRGYSSQISCKECGEVITCPHCSVSLTYHTDSASGKLMCHLCGYTAPTPRECPSCRADKLSFLGFGTQKLEGELARFLPDMPIMRMDADTTSGKMAYDTMLEDFREGNADILLGTQMVAKGHDFPRVTLVGVALADTSLYVSDFRAAERTFSLLTQVIGRAGRATDGGIAVIQTFSPNNETIRLACKQDYDGFYEGEIALRRELSYPPFCDMVQLTLTADSESELFRTSKMLSENIVAKINAEYSDMPFVVFGPFEAGVYKLNEKYRMRMVVKCKLTSKSRRLFADLLADFAKERAVTLAVDLNPLTV